MLSYQHAYHAGNMADVHKHALLASALDYMVQKPKPLSYIETHSGRGLYDLGGTEALKTGEAAAGISKVAGRFAPDHPYLRALAHVRATGGATAYPGSPLIAEALLRPEDRITLAEMHPGEVQVLRRSVTRADVRETDGEQLAISITPPEPRRGLLMIDPSYELKDEFVRMPKLLMQLHRKWPVGVLILWYPVLASGAHDPLVRALADLESMGDKALHHQVRFPPARPGHGMIGSGMVVINPPWGLADAAAEVARVIG